MSRQNKIIIAIAAAVIILGLLFGLIWWLANRPTLPQEQTETNTSIIQIPGGLPEIGTSITDVTEPLVGEKSLESSLKATAVIFAERFGSYSNEGDFSNLDSLSDLMTVRMKNWTESYKASQRVANTDNSVYYGVTTQAITVDIVEFDENLGRAEIVVKTQRQIAKGSTINPKASYQDLNLDLVNTGDGWKVDSATWQ